MSSHRFRCWSIVAIAVLLFLLSSIVEFQQNVDSVRRDPLVWEDVSGSTVDQPNNHSEKRTANSITTNTTKSTDPPIVVSSPGRGVTIEEEPPPVKATIVKAGERPDPGVSKKSDESNVLGHHAYSPYAYVFAIWRLDPDSPSYKGYFANILVATRLLRLHGSKADFVAIIKLHYDSSHQALPLGDLQLLGGMGIRIHYLPKEETDLHLNIYGTMFHKFTVFNLTEYRQVMYLDSDIMPMNNLDYLMEQADHGFLKPTVVIASNREPSTGGMMIVRPNATVYKDIQRIIQEWGPRLGNGKEWDETMGVRRCSV
jgi:hypothetical protein